MLNGILLKRVFNVEFSLGCAYGFIYALLNM